MMKSQSRKHPRLDRITRIDRSLFKQAAAHPSLSVGAHCLRSSSIEGRDIHQGGGSSVTEVAEEQVTVDHSASQYGVVHRID